MRKLVNTALAVGLLGTLALTLIKTLSPPWRFLAELRKRAHISDYVEHTHAPLVHTHDHPHVTHNRREGADELVGEWEHLTALHAHEHNHSPITHSHLPHVNAEHEHLGEAHIHDHSHPSES